MGVRRVFLDWRQPGLPAAADWLGRQFGAPGALDLGNVLVVVPGSRAGRRLLEILVQRAEADGLFFCPPEIVTLGRLPEQLYEAKQRAAGRLVQELAWAEALRRCGPDALRPLVAAPPAEDDLAGWLALAEMLSATHRELAEEKLDFGDVFRRGAELPTFREGDRWQLMAELQQKYLQALDNLGLWDIQTARIHAIDHRECRTDRQIVLIGAVDLNRVQKEILDQVAEHVTALVIAPEELAERFDAHGCLRPEAWTAAQIALEDGQIELAGGPAQQAAAATGAIAALDGRYAAEDIAVGVPDVRLVPYLQQHLRQCGADARYGPGEPAVQSPPCRLLEAVADFLESRSFASFAALVRHPAVEERLAAAGVPARWLSDLDECYGEHLPAGLEDLSWCAGERFASVRAACRAVEKLVDGLAGENRPLGAWAEPIAGLLVEVFGAAPLDRTREPDRSILEACEAIHGVLAEHRDVPEPLACPTAGAEALRLALRALRSTELPPPAQRGAIELLGWLELPLNDAPALVVTGMNEGFVPSSINADMFLPNQVRLALGIEDNDRRYARDAYALSVLAASRRALRLVVGRRTADGDPLAPSRLLFACDGETMARRVRRLLGAEPPQDRHAQLGRLQPGPRAAFDLVPPQPLREPITSMRVTEFKDYLACPYRYYLRHCLKLSAADDRGDELDGAAFGSLAHAVLREFGASAAAASAQAEEVFRFLDDALEKAVRREYGKAPLAAILVQAQQLRLRLEAFARWQAARTAEGWRIEHVEVSPPPGKAQLPVDGQPMGLRGRIDRIDCHAATGRRMLLDYKTADAPKDPERSHRERDGRWIDLQLPLYRHLARYLGIDGPVELGYVQLPKDTNAVGLAKAEWTDADLAEADRAAEEVVRGVRAGVFWPMTSPPPDFFDEFAAICQDGQFPTALPEGDDA